MNLIQKRILVDNIPYLVVAAAKDEETEKDYVVYTDEKVDKDKGLTLYCVEYYVDGEEFIPIKITDEEEKEVAVKLINEVMVKLASLVKRK